MELDFSSFGCILILTGSVELVAIVLSDLAYYFLTDLIIPISCVLFIIKFILN